MRKIQLSNSVEALTYVVGRLRSTHQKAIQDKAIPCIWQKKAREGKPKQLNSGIVPEITAKLTDFSSLWKQYFVFSNMLLNFSQNVSDGMYSCHFGRLWGKQACQRPRTACGNDTLHAILIPLFFFQNVKCCETLAGARQCQKVFNHIYIYLFYSMKVPCSIFNICHYY